MLKMLEDECLDLVSQNEPSPPTTLLAAASAQALRPWAEATGLKLDMHEPTKTVEEFFFWGGERVQLG